MPACRSLLWLQLLECLPPSALESLWRCVYRFWNVLVLILIRPRTHNNLQLSEKKCFLGSSGKSWKKWKNVCGCGLTEPSCHVLAAAYQTMSVIVWTSNSFLLAGCLSYYDICASFKTQKCRLKMGAGCAQIQIHVLCVQASFPIPVSMLSLSQSLKQVFDGERKENWSSGVGNPFKKLGSHNGQSRCCNGAYLFHTHYQDLTYNELPLEHLCKQGHWRARQTCKP